jgi:hypothetical protein
MPHGPQTQDPNSLLASNQSIPVSLPELPTPSFAFCKPNALVVMLQAAELLLLEGLSKDTVNCFLKVEIKKWKLNNPEITKRTEEQSPKSIETFLICLGLSPKIIHSTCCPTCFAIYLPTARPTYWSIKTKQKLKEITSTTHCTARFYSTSKRHVQSLDGSTPTCGTALFKSPQDNGSYPYTPVRIFSYCTLAADWLRSKICNPGFEDLLDSSLSQPNLKNGCMKDVWDGRVWKTFWDPNDLSKLDTSNSGNLVFSLFVDWFNPFCRKYTSPVSVGAVVLTCLNLPPSIRYQEENLFLFGIIPGPSEPLLDQINSLLQPLVDELQGFWRGICFDWSFRNPHGQFFKAVIFPPIADLPALRKTSGFSLHNSTNFCSHCLLTTKDINIIDPKKFKARDHESHLAQLFEWFKALTDSKRKEISDKEGVWYSVFVSLGLLCDCRTQDMGDNNYISGKGGGQGRINEE